MARLNLEARQAAYFELDRWLRVAVKRDELQQDHWHARSYVGPNAGLTVPELEAISL